MGMIPIRLQRTDGRMPVILCKNCRYFEEVNPVSGLTRCRKWKQYGMVCGSDYCSLAERRTARDE